MSGLFALLPTLRIATFLILVAILAGTMLLSTMRMLATRRARLLFIALFAISFAVIAGWYLHMP